MTQHSAYGHLLKERGLIQAPLDSETEVLRLTFCRLAEMAHILPPCFVFVAGDGDTTIVLDEYEQLWMAGREIELADLSPNIED